MTVILTMVSYQIFYEILTMVSYQTLYNHLVSSRQSLRLQLGLKPRLLLHF